MSKDVHGKVVEMALSTRDSHDFMHRAWRAILDARHGDFSGAIREMLGHAPIAEPYRKLHVDVIKPKAPAE